MTAKKEETIRLNVESTGEETALGMTARGLQEGMTAAPEGKGMTPRASARPTAPPPKPADGGSSAKPKP